MYLIVLNVSVQVSLQVHVSVFELFEVLGEHRLLVGQPLDILHVLNL